MLADPALVEVLLGPHGHLHVAGLLGDRQLDAGRPAGVDDRVALGDVEGHRLLEVDVLAGRGRLQRPAAGGSSAGSR